jgi:hypothetical protein
MLRSFVCLLLFSLMLAVQASWQTSGVLTISERTESEFMSGSQSPRKPRKKSTPTPTPTPTPAPTTTPTPTPSPSPRYPAPVVDENNPAESPELVSLIGTFRLNDDELGKVSQDNYPEQNAEQLKLFGSSVQASLAAPLALAIDLRGKTVNIVSTRVPRFTFEADGLEHVELLPEGRSIRTSATIEGANLVVKSSGSGQDFKVAFEPIPGGRLRVTRQFSSETLSQPVVVQNIYERIADVAQWSSFQLEEHAAQQLASRNPEFIVPNGVSLVATLNNDLTTKQAKTGDRFTMTVRAPSQFEGAIIEGHVTDVQRVGSATGRSGLTIHFDTVRLPKGKSYKFAGLVESVRTPPGVSVRVENEASMRDENQGTTKTAASTTAGVVATAGVWKGTAIGGASGAGSVVVLGKDDLELPRGSELLIRASKPK